MRFIKTNSVELAAKILSDTISEHLNKGEKVLWLIPGGSAARLAVAAGKNLAVKNLSNLQVTLTDERFVSVGSADSNWQQILEAGFNVGEAELFPVLDNGTMDRTTDKYDKLLSRLLSQADYGLALFGMGPDGHIAALFPAYPQLRGYGRFALAFDNSPKPPPKRLTMTFEAIKELDEAVIFAVGEEKRGALEKLKGEATVDEQPAQYLKKLAKLTIFNDQIGEEI